MKTIKNSFASGELSPDLEGRTDLSKYATGAQLLSNFFPTRFGGVSNRPGTEYIGKTPWQSRAYRRLVPFQFSVEQSYMLEFTGRTATFLDDFESSTLSSIWQTSDTYTVGDSYLNLPLSSVTGSTVLYDSSTETDFFYDGNLTYPAFPDGSATDVWNHTQYVRVSFPIFGEIKVGFTNGSYFSASGYKGYFIDGDFGITSYVDATVFTDVYWFIKKVGTVLTVGINDVELSQSIVSNIAHDLTLGHLIEGVTGVFGTAKFHGIEQGTAVKDTNFNADNLMRVVKDGAIVLTSLKNSTYKWTASGSGTAEYYCELSAGGDPSIPGAVEIWEDGSLIDEGTIGSLSASEWAFGDNDSLGYKTVYIRTAGDTDPDAGGLDSIQIDYQIDTGIFNTSIEAMTYAQSKDTLFLAGNFAPKSILRTGDDAWTISDLSFTPTVAAPTDVYAAITGFSATDKKEWYKVANIDEQGNQSLPSAEIALDLQLAWPAAGRVDLYVNNITDGLESTPVFQWTASATATNEYYVDLNGGGDPSIAKPSTVWEDKVEMTEGTLGSLAIGEWAYGDNDSLGYDTMYVRIAASADPDTKAVGYITFKKTTETQYRIYKNLRGDWGWLGDVDRPWFLDDDDLEPDIGFAPKEDRDPFNTGDTDDYPWAVGIFEQRLVYARSNNDPQRVWTSVTGDLTNFATSRPLSSEDPITVDLVSGGRVDEIRHLLPLQRLIVLTKGSEWTLGNGENSDALTPFSVQFRNQGYEGISTEVQPLGITNQAVFVQRNGKDIRTTSFNLEDAGYASEELNLLAQHLFDGRTVTDWCYQQHPSNVVWMVMSDGEIVSMTYLPQQQLIAFARHVTDGLVKAIGSFATTDNDAVYFIVERDTGTFIEKLSERYFGENVRDAKFLDSALTYNNKQTLTGVAVTATEITVTCASHGYSNGDFVLIDDTTGISATGSNDEYTAFNDRYYKVANVATNTFELESIDGTALTSTDFTGTYISGGSVYECTNVVSGLDHLEGETVSVLADGQAIGTFTVSSGSITLGTTAPGYAVVHAGLPYVCDIQTLRFDIPSNQGTAQYSKKNIKKMIMRFKDSVGGFAGPDADNLTEIKWRQNEEWLQPNALKTEDVEHKIKSTWEREGRVYFRQSDPLPTTMLALIMEFELGDS